MRRLSIIALLIFAVSLMGWQWFQTQIPRGAAGPSTYLGAQACAQCHQSQYQAWQGSHHALAMQPANPQTVLGDFKDASFLYNGITTRFFQRDGRFFVNTDGPDGQLKDYAIQYAFGLTPLQQYGCFYPTPRLCGAQHNRGVG